MKEYNIYRTCTWRLCRRRQMGAVLFLWVFIISVFSFYPQVYYIIKILQVYIMYNTSFLDGSGGGVVFFEYIII